MKNSSDQYPAISCRQGTHRIRIDNRTTASNRKASVVSELARACGAIGECRIQAERVGCFGGEGRFPISSNNLLSQDELTYSKPLFRATAYVKRIESPPTLDTAYRLVNVVHPQRRCLCNDTDINVRIRNLINRRGSSPKRSERGDRTRGRPCGGLGVMERGMDGRMTMRMTWSGARARVSNCVIDSFGLKADGKQGTLFGRERTCIVVFQLWLWFFR
jgi:hypothetical protein